MDAQSRKPRRSVTEHGTFGNTDERRRPWYHRSVFKFGRTSRADLRAIASRAEDSEPTYRELGATMRGERPAGYRHDSYEQKLAPGSDTFALARKGLGAWAAHTHAGLTVEPDLPPALGMTVAIAAPLGPLTAIALCRIVATVEEPERFGFAYGTLPGHPERGEEAFVVERRGDEVVFRIVAFSRPAEALARLGGPVTRRIQRTTTQRYLDGLAAFVAQATT